jgi:PTS system mannose-specific IIB component/fructoselysine and glucoselysine-specific PTS system IIB component
MAVELMRIDDRLIHGQVVVGWGQPLDIEFIVLVDDAVATSDWEQELYRMGVPPHMDVYFVSVADALPLIPKLQKDERPGILLTPDVTTMHQLVKAGVIEAVNVGGIHHRPGRDQKLRYVFLTPPEAAELEAMGKTVRVFAQDLPGAEEFSLEQILQGTMEGLMATLWKEVLGIELKLPLRRMTFAEAMDKYGVDKPDLRCDLVLCDVSEPAKTSNFPIFLSVVESGGIEGGVWPSPPEGHNLMQLFIEVDDIDATLATATAAGAQVLFPRQQLPDGDAIAILLDPAGLSFGLYTPASRSSS